MQALSSIFPNLFGQLYAKLYMAQALCALGQRSEAVSALHEALDMALPDQVYLPFAENYAGIRDLLSALVLPERRAELERIAALAERLDGSLARLRAEKPALTPREREIYELIKSGTTSHKAIAAALYISVPTVKNLLSRIYEKTGVSSKTQLVLLEL